MNTKGNKLAIFFQPRTLLPNLVSGLIFGLLNISYAIALAAFIFTGDISNHISIGVSAVLISCFLTGWPSLPVVLYRALFLHPIVILPNDSKCLTSALNLAKLKS